MAFIPKAWRDRPSRQTPLNADALIDLEQRVHDGAVADAQTAIAPSVATKQDAATAATDAELAAGLATKVDLAAVGHANGVASLDGGGKVPVSQIPGTASRTISLSPGALAAGATYTSSPFDPLPADLYDVLVSATIAADHDGILSIETSTDGGATWAPQASAATSSGTATVSSGPGGGQAWRIKFACGSAALTTPPTLTVTLTTAVPA